MQKSKLRQKMSVSSAHPRYRSTAPLKNNQSIFIFWIIFWKVSIVMETLHHKGEPVTIMLTIRRNCVGGCGPVHMYELSLILVRLGQHNCTTRIHLIVGRFFLNIDGLLPLLPVLWLEGEKSKTLLNTTVILHRNLWGILEEVPLNLGWLWRCGHLMKGRLISFLRKLLDDRNESTLVLLCFLEIILQNWNPTCKKFKRIFLSLTIFEWYVMVLLPFLLLPISTIISGYRRHPWPLPQFIFLSDSFGHCLC